MGESPDTRHNHSVIKPSTAPSLFRQESEKQIQNSFPSNHWLINYFINSYILRI